MHNYKVFGIFISVQGVKWGFKPSGLFTCTTTHDQSTFQEIDK